MGVDRAGRKTRWSFRGVRDPRWWYDDQREKTDQIDKRSRGSARPCGASGARPFAAGDIGMMT